jgi:NNP family nitrate/nitrite transporter-like MFS transporter
MGAATIGVMYFVEIKDFTGFLVMFLILFATAGIGNGSTYRMIPSIFREEMMHRLKPQNDAARIAAFKAAGILSGAALGFIGAIGACGGFLIPSSFGKSIALTGGPHLALEIFLGFYATCLALTWWFYLRKTSVASGVPSLAEARV